VNVLPKDIASVLGREKALGREVRDYADLDAVVESGLPAAAVARVKDLFQGHEELYRRYFSMTEASVEGSRRLERIARLYSLSLAAFGNSEAAKEFLFTQHERLANRPPIFLTETELALKQVEPILVAIAYGLPA
jgi:putative toxin-antitoxin system antitoxin component (TIGR02293 family)